jgi:1-deoxy-D-xylulose-5-phosphate reductoisomerase
MRLPLQYCLTWPDRMPSLTRTLDLAGVGRLDFHAVNHNRFPCLKLAYRALEAGQAATCALNAANQVAVEAFIAGRIAFGDIPKVIAPVLARLSASHQPAKPGISALLHVESWALTQAANAVAARAGQPLRRKE